MKNNIFVTNRKEKFDRGIYVYGKNVIAYFSLCL